MPYVNIQITAGATREQAAGIQQITTASAELDQSTHRNAAMFEESTTAIDVMKSEFESLLENVRAFRLDEGENGYSDG